MSSYTCFGYWGHFHILEKLGLSLGRVFFAIWDVIALWWSKFTEHSCSVRCRDPTHPIPALGQKLIVQMQWLTLAEWYCLKVSITAKSWLWGSQTADEIKFAGIKSKWHKVFSLRFCSNVEAISWILSQQPEKQKIT